MILSRKPVFWAVSFGHMVVDMFSGMGPVMLAFLSAHLVSMTNTQLGFAVSAYSFTGAISQPLFGWLCDKSGGRRLGAGGVAWTVSMLMLALVIAQTTGQYALMLVPYVLAALGSGAFHPVGAMHASECDPEQAAANTSVFFLMGQLGLATGPALAGFLLDRLASQNSLFTQALGPVYQNILMERGTVAPILALSLIALPVVLFMAFSIPTINVHLASRLSNAAQDAREAAASTSLPTRVLILFAVVVALRSLINPGSVAYIPRLFQLKGWDATAYGFVTSLFWLGGGIAGVVMGNMAARYDSRYLVSATLVLAAPAMFLLTVFDGPLTFVMALAAGALSGASHGLLVVQAQALIPGRKGFASGAILGFMFTTGAIGTLIIGRLSDSIGLAGALHVVAAVTVVTGLLGLALPPDRRAARVPARGNAAAPSGAD